MTGYVKIIMMTSLLFITVSQTYTQPVWVTGTPNVASAGPLSITLNYGIDRLGTVYVIVYNYNNTDILTSSTVRSRALNGPGGSVVATAVRSVRRADIGKILQVVLNVADPDQVHTVYIVAADSKALLQQAPVRLNATTLPCPEANAGQGGEECDLNFNLNAVAVFGTGVWTRISGPGNASFSPDSRTPTARVTVTAYGTYIFRWTETQGVCRSSDDITVVFYQPPVANAGTGGNQCGMDFVLSAVTTSIDARGTWTMTSGTGTARFSPDASSPTATVTISEYGAKVFTWTVTNGPCSDSSDVAVNFYQQPVANAGTGGNNCGQEFYFNAIPSAGTGTWTRVSGPGTVSFSPDNHSPTARVTVNEFGTYVFRWTEVNGPCTSAASVTVSFFEQVPADAGDGGDECDRDFLLNAVPGVGTGTWTKLGGPGNATFNPNQNQYNAFVTVTQPGAYDFAWTVVSNNCSSVDIIRVVFHDLPSVSAGPDAVVCEGGNIRLHAEGTGTFLWNPGNLLDNPTLPDPLASPLTTTHFTVTLTDQWNCKNSDQVTIEVREKPIVDAGPDQVLDFLFETYLEASELNSNETGEWIILSGNGTFSNKNDNKTRVEELLLGDNKFLWTVTNGVCTMSSDTVLIKINELTLPTLITPNQDGINDYFEVRGIENLGKTGLNIFNRWGASVYNNNDYENNWDGKDDNGNLLQEDTYFYILRPEKTTAIKGYIVIKR